MTGPSESGLPTDVEAESKPIAGPVSAPSRLTPAQLRHHLLNGQVIPAHPLALTARRTLDERRQRALTRYYMEAGAGGVAVGVHTTQFAIRNHGLLQPVLELAVDVVRMSAAGPFTVIAGAAGITHDAVREAELAATCGCDAILLSLGGLDELSNRELLAHCRAVADVLPLFGFYLQPAVGGRLLDAEFWRRLAELPALVAVKIAPFSRYRTIEVVRAITASGREDVALYTGNDDSIVYDLTTPFPSGRDGTVRMHGGLLGHWAVWTRAAVKLLGDIRAVKRAAATPESWLARDAAVTEMNAAVFDAANGFAGCIPGIHEVLRRQGLLEGTWALDPNERLSPGQAEEIARVAARYPELTDDDWVGERLDRWLS